jgi:hypothetical protein
VEPSAILDAVVRASLEGQMKRPAIAFLLLAALGVGVEGGDLPKPISSVQRHKSSNFTPYVRGTRQKLPVPIWVDSNDRHRGTRQTHAVRGK